MKSNKGITLVSLVVYIIVMIIVIGVMGAIASNFYNNTNSMQVDTEEILEFNNFNTYFLKEIKAPENAVDTIGNEGEYILFESGNSFSFSDNKIYYNDMKICEKVQRMKIESLVDENGNIIDDVIHVEITFSGFSKSMNYKVEDIY